MSFQYEDEYRNQMHVNPTKEGGVYIHVADSEGAVGLEVPEYKVWDLILYLLKVAP